MKKSKIILLAVLVILVAIQFVPVERSNPPATQKLKMPADVAKIMKRSCFDCHSNETVWPWYSYVAPVSWLIADDVEEGRHKMNFSEWDHLKPRKQRKRLDKCVEEIEEGEMPLEPYQVLHSNTKVSEAELAVIKNWVDTVLNHSQEMSGD